MQTSICYKHKMEPFLFLKLAKVEILTLIIIGFCCLKLKEQTFQNLPNIDQILEYENYSRKNGSQIDFDSLLGGWKFQTVWRQDKEDLLSGLHIYIYIQSFYGTTSYAGHQVRIL